MKTPKVSVIVAVFNGEKELVRCMDSLLAQTLEDMEILLIDDGSSDRTPQLCAQYEEIPGVRVFRRKNSGVAATRNFGVEMAKGTYIGFCDHDDVVHPRYFETLVCAAEQTGAQAAVGGFTAGSSPETFAADPEEEDPKEPYVLSRQEAMRRLVKGEPSFKGYVWNKLFEKKLFRGLSFPEGAYIEDLSVTFRLLHRAERVAVLDWKGYYYTQRPNSITNAGWTTVHLDYVRCWKQILSLCRKEYPELEEDARAQTVSSALYTLGCLRKSGISDPKTVAMLLGLIRDLGEGYGRADVSTVTPKRKMLVKMISAVPSGLLQVRHTGGNCEIDVEMNGRLGNQLFRYAFARWLIEQAPPGQDREKIRLRFDFSAVFREARKQEMDGWEDSLRHFHVLPYSYYQKSGRILKNETSPAEKAVMFPILAGDRIAGRKGAAARLAWRQPFLPWFNRHQIFQFFAGYDYPWTWREGADRLLVSGPFECARYPEEIREILLEEFIPKYPVPDHNRELMEKITGTNSVCVTVRRGNYLQYRSLDLCTVSYFERAAEKMCAMEEDCVFFLFSDDIDWVKENIRIDAPVYYEQGDDPVWEKLRLMYSCRHFIISNSTFSWWAQFLGRAPDKKVIAPSRWFNGDYQPPLYEKGWLLISPDSEK